MPFVDGDTYWTNYGDGGRDPGWLGEVMGQLFFSPQDSYDRLVRIHASPLRMGDDDWFYCVVVDGDHIEAETNYALFQTNVDGASHLFAVGCYRDRIGRFDNQLKFVERLVVLDTFSIPTLLAKPV